MLAFSFFFINLVIFIFVIIYTIREANYENRIRLHIALQNEILYQKQLKDYKSGKRTIPPIRMPTPNESRSL